MQPQAVASPEQSRAGRLLPLALKPGFGFEDLFLGQSEGHVLELWGEPDERDQIDESSYFIYRKLALEIELRSGHVYRIFFFARKQAKTEIPTAVDGITFGTDKRALVRKFGLPTERGGGRYLSNRKYLRTWLMYSKGVQFEFGKSGKLELITIFEPGGDTSD